MNTYETVSLGCMDPQQILLILINIELLLRGKGY